jgi:hypothetical protein
MSIRSSHVWLLVVLGLLGLGATPGPAQSQIEELPRPDTAHAASFGISVALGDSIAAVGASGEARCGPNAGAVYVYERRPGPTFDEWRGSTRITPRTCQSESFFGERVVLDENRLFVSATDSEPFADEGANRAYMFRRDSSGTWRQTARFTGDPNHRDGSFATDIDLNGNRAVVSTSGNPSEGRHGAVYVYTYDADAEEWTQSARLTSRRPIAAGVLGRAVALSGRRLAVAASTYFEEEPGSVYVFRYDTADDKWNESAVLDDIDSFFIDLDLHDSVLLVGEDRAGDDNSGQATVYTPSGDWTQTATLRPSHPYESGSFGTAVSLDDQRALVTGYGEQLDKDFNIDRVVYAFQRRSECSWTQRTILDIGQVDFGAALDQHGSRALVSSVPEDAPGAVYLIRLP